MTFRQIQSLHKGILCTIYHHQQQHQHVNLFVYCLPKCLGMGLPRTFCDGGPGTEKPFSGLAGPDAMVVPRGCREGDGAPPTPKALELPSPAEAAMAAEEEVEVVVVVSWGSGWSTAYSWEVTQGA